MSHLVKRNNKDGLFPVFWNRYFGNDLFDHFLDAELPAVNIKENKKEFKLEVSIPGYAKEDIELNVDKNILTVSAKKETKSEEKGEDDKILRQEFSSSSFHRSFTLPENIDTTKIGASQKSGILKIVLPKLDKAPEDKKKKIEIK